MKIEYSNLNSMLFQDLETGDVFREGGDIFGDLFMVTEEVDTQLGGTYCVRLSDGAVFTFGDAVKVELVKAKVVIE